MCACVTNQRLGLAAAACHGLMAPLARQSKSFQCVWLSASARNTLRVYLDTTEQSEGNKQGGNDDDAREKSKRGSTTRSLLSLFALSPFSHMLSHSHDRTQSITRPQTRPRPRNPDRTGQDRTGRKVLYNRTGQGRQGQARASSQLGIVRPPHCLGEIPYHSLPSTVSSLEPARAVLCCCMRRGEARRDLNL